MKKVLIDKNLKQYKANLHCHSTNSDGKLSPAQLKEAYMQRGYSVIAFTDHEHIIDNSALCDKDFVAITGCELSIKEFPKLSTLKSTAMKVAHLNLYAKDPHNNDTPFYSSVADHFINDRIKDQIFYTCEDKERVYGKDGINEIIDTCNKKGFLVCYNHPVWSLENARDYLNYKNLWAVEIYNHGAYQSGLCEYSPNIIDDFAREGQNLCPLANNDNHNYKALDHISSDSFGGFNYIVAKELTYDSIIEAMENRNIYASLGPQILSLIIEDGVAKIEYKGGVQAAMNTCGRRAKRVFNDTYAEFEVLESDKYLRFTVTDKYGKSALTPAYFVKDIL